MKAFLRELPLRQETLAKLSVLDVADLPSLAAYLHAAGEALGSYIPAGELTKLQNHLEQHLSPAQRRQLSQRPPRHSLGARLDPKPSAPSPRHRPKSEI